MPRAKRERQYLRLNKGLFTEGGYLNTPPDVWTDAANVIPNQDGTVARRKGVDYEEGYVLGTTNTTVENQLRAYTVGYWDSAGGSSINFLVIQRGATVEFYRNIADDLSSTKESFTIALGSYKPSGNANTSGEAPIECISANGRLIIVSHDTEVLLVEYDPTGASITTTQLDLKIRDLEGVDDGLEVDEEPTGNPYSAAHTYNLQNQGWKTADINTYRTYTGGDEPSNAQQWFYGVSAGTFAGATLASKEFGSTPAPKGYYILDLFNQQRDAYVATVADVTEVYRPTTLEFFAGRAWYAGIESETLLSNVYFSQVGIDGLDFGKCYQKNDPTAEIISDILDSDGGVIPIQNCGRILNIKSIMDSLFVFADNGIWRVGPGSNNAFSASSYSVEQISTYDCISRDSVVKLNDTIYFWSSSGICRLGYKYSTAAGVTGKFNVEPISDTTIKTLYGSIVISGKIYAQGVYDTENRIVYWAYNSATDADTTDYRFRKDTILCLDTKIGAWYKHTISPLASNSPYIYALCLTKGRGNITVEATVITSSDDTVLEDGGDTVVVDLDVDSVRNRSIKFLVMTYQGANDYRLTMADWFNQRDSDTKWKEWYTADSAGVDVIPYLNTGYSLDNPGHKMDATYLTTYVIRTDTGTDGTGEAINSGSVYVQAKWEWTDGSASNRWSTPEQLYRPQMVVYTSGLTTDPPSPFPVIPAKSKLRGAGRTLQLYYYGTGDKDFKLAGFTIDYNVLRST